MKGFDTLKIKSAIRQHNKFDLSMTHLTTLKFGQIVPLTAIETVPGDKFNVNAHYFSRLAPLVVPTYGKFSFKTVAGYVPYHMLAADADAWFAGKTTWEGNTPIQRTISVDILVNFILTYCITTSGATQANSQFTTINSSGTAEYHLFTPVGAYYLKILNALGYATPAGVDLQTTSTWYTEVKNLKLSAYPLLAFFKLYNDYMSQSQRFNTSQLTNLLNAIKYQRSVTGQYTPSTGTISAAGMYIMFSNLFLNYENDYFTSAWQNAGNPLTNNEQITTYTVPATPQVSAMKDIEDSVTTGPKLKNTLAATLQLSQRALDFLKSFDNWVRRNNYSGSRAVQQVFSRFGIKTSDYRDHYANVLGTETLPVQVGDVTATADSGTVLGSYAGKGIMSGSKGISMQADDFGILIILGYFTVTPMNPYGNDRKVLRVNPLDYYNPEFDGLGADAISVGEYYGNPCIAGSNVPDNATYGFTERYNAYRYGRDMVTGDFRDQRVNAGMNAWHTARDMSAIREAGLLYAQTPSVNTLPQTDSEYRRIFNVTDTNVDTFYLTAKFDIDAIRPMLNLNQVPQLGEGDTIVPRNGNVIS